MSTPYPELVESLREAERILFFTGAGISTNSGIPDYRGPKGLWKTEEPVYYQDFMASDDARVRYWHQKLAGWEGYRDAQPNPVHHAIAELEQAGRVAMVVTQNIDGLHKLAGTSEERLVEIHGTNRAIECQSCQQRSDPQAHFDNFRSTEEAPMCPCGGWLKPATISFGQALRQNDLRRAAAGALAADLVIAMGSTLSVYPAASIPLLAVEQNQVPYVIINRGVTEHDDLPVVSLRLEGDVGDVFVPAASQALGAR